MSRRRAPFSNLHMVGIGGAGMSALAEILLDDGITLSGCDASPSERLDALTQRGALISIGHDPAHLEGVEAVITTPAVSASNPELIAAHSRGLPILSRAEMLAESMGDSELIAVAGSHGKTTTSALIAHLLQRGGLEPSVALGGVLAGRSRSGWRGRGRLAVCEADEYDRSFLKLRPLMAVLTNVEAEHLDYYGSQEALFAAFSDFLASLPPRGLILFCGDDPGARNLQQDAPAEAISYGLGPENDFRGIDLGIEDGFRRFSVIDRGRHLGEARIPLAGKHNLLNALGALGAGLRAGLSFETASDGLESFPGVFRRFEELGESGGVLYIDDYAHHPTELRAVIAAARELYPDRRILALFQPHLASRTHSLAADFAEALAEADQALILPIFLAREKPIEGLSHRILLDKLEELGKPGRDAEGLEALPRILNESCREGDLLLALNAGSLSSWMRDYLAGGLQ